MKPLHALVRHAHMTRGFYTVSKIFDLDGTIYNLPALDHQFSSMRVARVAAKHASLKLESGVYEDIHKAHVAFAVRKIGED